MTVPIVPGRGERDIVVDVTIKSDTRGAARAADALDDVDRSAGRAGKSLHGMGMDAKALDAEITKATKSLKSLEAQMVATGDKTMRRRVSAERSWLGELSRLRAAMRLEEGPGGAGGFANIGDMLSKVPTRWSAIGGAVAAVAGPGPISPFLGASIAGLGAGAIGTAGLAAGILSAAQDPQVKEAAKAFGQSISKEFFSGGDVFINPIREGLGILDQAVKDLDLPETFAKLAPVLTTIAEGFADFARNIMPGVNAAFDRMGPFADVAAEGIAELGSALGDFIDEVTASEGAVMGLDAIFKVINATIVLTGRGLHMLSDVFAAFIRSMPPLITNLPLIGPMLRDIMVRTSESPEKIEPFIGGLEEIDEGAVGVRKALEDADNALESFLNEVQKIIPEAFSLEEAQDQAAEALSRLNEQIQEQIDNGEEGAASLEGNSDAARRNREAVRDLVEMYGGLIAKAAESGESTDALKQSLKEQLIQMGFNEAEVQRYVDQLDRIPVEKITKISAENAQALAAVQETERELRRLASMSVSIPITAYQAYRAGERASGLQQFHEGGFTNWPRNEGRLAMLHGQELVLNQDQQKALGAVMGGGTTTVTEVHFSGDIDSAFASAFMRLIRLGHITILPSAVRT